MALSDGLDIPFGKVHAPVWEYSPLLFQKINCLYILLIIVSGYGMVSSVTKRVEGRIIYLLLMATYGPLIFRVSEVYGDIPSLAWMMFSCMCFFLFYKVQKKWQRVVLALGFSGAAVLACTYKRNCLIYVVAFLLVTVVVQLGKRSTCPCVYRHGASI